MIKYEFNGNHEYRVLLEGKRVGTILSKEGKGWWYKPKNGQPGEVFDSLAKVKRSIEYGDE